MDKDQIVTQGYKDGVPVGEMAAQLGQHRSAVLRIAKRLGLTHPGRFSSGGIIGTDTGSLKGESIMSREPTQAELNAFKAHCEANNLPFDKWRAFWHKTKEYSSLFANKAAEQEQREYHTQMLADLRKLAPKYRKRKVDPTGEHMLVLPQADIHVGKWAGVTETGKKYNTEIAVERARAGTDALVAKGNLFGVKQYVVCIGNDILHTDNGKTSTAGTPQDNDGSWFENFRAAKDLYISMIEQLALHGDVLLVHVPSNHDWRTGYSLSEVVMERFYHHPNVTGMITERHRKYLVFGDNLLMFSHGDGAKEKDLHWHMATEAAEAWSKTSFRYVYLGHLHHKIKKVAGHQSAQTEKDLIGVTELVAGTLATPGQDVNIEYVRSSSGTDSWHDRNGYTSRPAMEAFLHHPTDGQVGRFTHFF